MFYSLECEEHYMRCYIDDPCKALQIPGTVTVKREMTSEV